MGSVSRRIFLEAGGAAASTPDAAVDAASPGQGAQAAAPASAASR
jgi:hypothetical protein